MKWTERPYDKGLEKTLVENNHPLLARLMAQRAIDDVDSFLNQKYKDLSHPFDFPGMKDAVDLFCEHALAKGKVAVFGDYDCDGITSSAMLKALCSSLGLKCDVFIPSRFDHGYGLNQTSVDAFIESFKTPPDLLICADCGSNNETEVQKLKNFGIKSIIIIDHHLVNEDLRSVSADALVNWHLDESATEMCTAGECFHFIRGIRQRTKKVNPSEYISYAALGTLADISPICGDNRIIVKYGLTPEALHKNPYCGLSSLISNIRLDEGCLTQQDISFRIAPRINSAGRIGSPSLAFNLLTETNHNKAEQMAKELVDCNKTRKSIQSHMETDAINAAKEHEYAHGIAIYEESFHGGINGIVAARIVDMFGLPSLVFSKHDDVVKGSGRAPEGIDLQKILKKCEDLFVTYGGHEAAAGMTLKKKCVDEIGPRFDKACKEYFEEFGKPDNVRFYDAKLKATAITLTTSDMVTSTLYPYCGKNNPEPVFVIPKVVVQNVRVIERDNWRMVTFYVEKDGERSEMDFRMFSDTMGEEANGKVADVYFSFPQAIRSNGFNSINVEDIRFGDAYE